ncbi:hypothetical protein FHW88_005221 [Mucilaginibacter sp. SG538B]|uniref:hypothetical protein n=1 Tax=Mucilaginibacter sp. SG538B TaxID=2587021 RepID=UPI00159DA981|nr:hypothetical protein [Mucilaginibacter sp. SG538B]NVM66903.1 hypothetical protein [Mucilaginibacter sp. SG538B]
MEKKDSILEKPIAELGASSVFCEGCKKMGYETLASILRERPEDLRAKQHFSYFWLVELIEFLKEKELLDLLQSMQGNSKA